MVHFLPDVVLSEMIDQDSQYRKKQAEQEAKKLCSIQDLKCEWMTIVILVIFWPQLGLIRICRQWKKCQHVILADRGFSSFILVYFKKDFMSLGKQYTLARTTLIIITKRVTLPRREGDQLLPCILGGQILYVKGNSKPFYSPCCHCFFQQILFKGVGVVFRFVG